MNWKKEQQKMHYSELEPNCDSVSTKENKKTVPNPTSAQKKVKGFSKLSKEEKLEFIAEQFLASSQTDLDTLKSFWHENRDIQKTIDEFSENTLSNFALPFGVCPNVLINDHIKCVPMVIEESSVVAAAAKAAKFWMERGGFKAQVLKTVKIGQVHFIFDGDKKLLENVFAENIQALKKHIGPLVSNMEKRGGGLRKLELRDLTEKENGYFQLWAEFETCDAMGANFINSVLEALGKKFELILCGTPGINEDDIQIVMAILSNYTPECVVRAWVECSLEELSDEGLGMSAADFAQKFSRAVRIATIDTNRATTHNKGIMNGVDSVILATGNDFRAIEAAAHTYASRDGQYKSLSKCEIKDGRFRFELELPLAVGTVGGLTALHPLAKMSLKILENPSANELMEVCAVIGLAQNFAALRSLVTTGIQKGHMKMHLMNILNHLEANDDERVKVKEKFEDEVISFTGIRDFLNSLRQYQ